MLYCIEEKKYIGFMLWKYIQLYILDLCYELYILDLCYENIYNLDCIYWIYVMKIYTISSWFFFQLSYLLTMISGIKLFIMSIYTFWKMYIGNIHLLWSYLNLSTSSRGLDMTTRGEYFQYTFFKMCILSQYFGPKITYKYLKVDWFT